VFSKKNVFYSYLSAFLLYAPVPFHGGEKIQRNIHNIFNRPIWLILTGGSAASPIYKICNISFVENIGTFAEGSLSSEIGISHHKDTDSMS
jgi:hypothetical protein